MQFRGEALGPAASVTFILFGVLEVVSGVVGNVLLLSVLFTSRLLGQANCHNFFVANLALADIVTLGYWMPFFVLDLILGFNPVMNQAHCQANGLIICICTVVSTLTLVSISLNRYLHVCHSRLYRRVFNRTTTIACCLLLWLIGAAVTVQPFFGHGALGSYYYRKDSHVCAYSSDTYPRVITVTLMLGSTLSIVYFNLAIFRFWRGAKLNLKTSIMAALPQTHSSTETAKSVGCEETELNVPIASNMEDSESDAHTASNTPDMSASRPSTENCETRGPRQGDDTRGSAQDDGKGSGPSCPTVTHVAPSSTSTTEDTNPKSHSSQGQHFHNSRICQDSDPVGGTVRNEARTKNETSRGARKLGVRKSLTFRQQLARRRRQQQKRERAFVRSLAVISLIMVICLLPFGVARVFERSHPLPAEVNIFLTLLLFVNNSLNWAVYGIMNRSFRREYAKLLKRIVPSCLKSPALTPATVSPNA